MLKKLLKEKKAVPTEAKKNEDSGCLSMEGLLKKKNSRGEWKPRYGQLSNCFFMTYKPKGNQPTPEVKESIDLRSAKFCEAANGVLTIVMHNGDTYEFTGKNLELWEERVMERAEWAQSSLLPTTSSGGGVGGGAGAGGGVGGAQDNSNSVGGEGSTKGAAEVGPLLISGWLMKKSHNKYQGLQERFVKLEGPYMRYFKKEKDTTESGSANMATAEFVRPYDATDAECRTFEIKDEDRVYIFQAPTPAEMRRWINVMEEQRTLAIKAREDAARAKILAETPIRIRWFDEDGITQFTKTIWEDVDDIYPSEDMCVSKTEEDGGEVNSSDVCGSKVRYVRQLKDHLECATELIGYLTDFVPECKGTMNRPARYDVLAVMMRIINEGIAKRMLPILSNATISPAADHDDDDSSAGAGSDDEEDDDDDDNNGEYNNKNATAASGALTTAAKGEGLLKGRHPILEQATLGELHQLIEWIARYQNTLKSIKCPVLKTDTAVSPKYCAIFDTLKDVCQLYVYGGSSGAKAGGAGAHLYDHCNKVWESVVRDPEEMLQRHTDGTFYTHAPVDMWEAIHQHVSLASTTNTAVLHAMIADTLVTSLSKVIAHIVDYVNSLEKNPRPELKDMELEFISALANDTAMHIEESIGIIDDFPIPEMREKLDTLFDSLTSTLVTCGQACLRRLAKLVMTDVQELINEVFMDEWLEGNQMQVATATLSDYMNDFQQFLVGFWSDKFVYTILEEVILSYVRIILFRKQTVKGAAAEAAAAAAVAAAAQQVQQQQQQQQQQASADSPAEKKGNGFFKSFFNQSKEKASGMMQVVKQVTVNAEVCAGMGQLELDEEVLGRLAQDVNILNKFFSTKAPQDTATEFLALVNEVSLMLYLSVDTIFTHVHDRIQEFPSSAAAIAQMAYAVLRLQGRTPRKEYDSFQQQVQGVVEAAATAAAKKEAEGVAEGRLGLLFNDVVPSELLSKGDKKKSTLAQRLKNMSNINMDKMRKGGKKKNNSNNTTRMEEEEEEEYLDDMPSGAAGGGGGAGGGGSASVLVESVLDVLNAQEQEDAEFAAAEEKERLRILGLRTRVGSLAYEGYLDKKSPAHNLWQRRYFKLVTRETHQVEDPFEYNLLWFKKEGGTVIKSIDNVAKHIVSIVVVQSARPLACVFESDRCNLMLMSEVGGNTHVNGSRVIPVQPNNPTKEDVSTSTGVNISKEEFTGILLVQSDGKQHLLRGAKIDRVIKWVNYIALISSLGYDQHEKVFNRDALNQHKEEMAEQASNPSFLNVHASRVSGTFTGAPPIRKSYEDEDNSGEAYGAEGMSPKDLSRMHQIQQGGEEGEEEEEQEEVAAIGSNGAFDMRSSSASAPDDGSSSASGIGGGPRNSSGNNNSMLKSRSMENFSDDNSDSEDEKEDDGEESRSDTGRGSLGRPRASSGAASGVSSVTALSATTLNTATLEKERERELRQKKVDEAEALFAARAVTTVNGSATKSHIPIASPSPSPQPQTRSMNANTPSKVAEERDTRHLEQRVQQLEELCSELKAESAAQLERIDELNAALEATEEALKQEKQQSEKILEERDELHEQLQKASQAVECAREEAAQLAANSTATTKKIEATSLKEKEKLTTQLRQLQQRSEDELGAVNEELEEAMQRVASLEEALKEKNREHAAELQSVRASFAAAAAAATATVAAVDAAPAAVNTKTTLPTVEEKHNGDTSTNYLETASSSSGGAGSDDDLDSEDDNNNNNNHNNDNNDNNDGNENDDDDDDDDGPTTAVCAATTKSSRPVAQRLPPVVPTPPPSVPSAELSPISSAVASASASVSPHRRSVRGSTSFAEYAAAHKSRLSISAQSIAGVTEAAAAATRAAAEQESSSTTTPPPSFTPPRITISNTSTGGTTTSGAAGAVTESPSAASAAASPSPMSATRSPVVGGTDAQRPFSAMRRQSSIRRAPPPPPSTGSLIPPSPTASCGPPLTDPSITATTQLSPTPQAASASSANTVIINSDSVNDNGSDAQPDTRRRSGSSGAKFTAKSLMARRMMAKSAAAAPTTTTNNNDS